MVLYEFFLLSFNQTCEGQTELCFRNTDWPQDIEGEEWSPAPMCYCALYNQQFVLKLYLFILYLTVINEVQKWCYWKYYIKLYKFIVY